jgi:hypothetical protein
MLYVTLRPCAYSLCFKQPTSLYSWCILSLCLHPQTHGVSVTEPISLNPWYLRYSAYIPEHIKSVTLSLHPWTHRVCNAQLTSLNSWCISATQPTPLNVCSDSIDQSPNERRRQAVAVYLIHLIPCALSLYPLPPLPLGINGFHFKWGGRVKTNMISQGAFEPCILPPWDSGGVDSNDPYRFS